MFPGSQNSGWYMTKKQNEGVTAKNGDANNKVNVTTRAV
jgi:hypothetical protein